MCKCFIFTFIKTIYGRLKDKIAEYQLLRDIVLTLNKKEYIGPIFLQILSSG